MKASLGIPLLVVSLAACGSSRQAGGTSAARPPVAAAPAASTAASRDTPANVLSRAVAVGAVAPALELPTASGARWSLAEAVHSGPVVLVFYRGYW